MDEAGIRLGCDSAWLELAHAGGDTWRVSADWGSCLKADFVASLTKEETADFAARMLSRLRAPSVSPFSVAVTPGRNNPLRLRAEPVRDGFAFFARLTPNGDDDVCHLQMEIDPIDADELCDMFDALYASSVL